MKRVERSGAGTLDRGEGIFEDRIARTVGEKVRALVPPEASAAREKAARMAIGILADGAHLERQEEVARKRDPLFRAAAEGVAAGLDQAYARRSRWQPRTDAERALFQEARRQVEGLGEQEKEQLGLFLTRWATQFESSFDYLLSEAGGPSYRKGVTDFFASDRYFHRH